MKYRGKERVNVGEEMGKEGCSWRVCAIESISWILNSNCAHTKRRRDKILVGPKPAKTGSYSQLDQGPSMKGHSLADGRKLKTPHGCKALDDYLPKKITHT